MEDSRKNIENYRKGKEPLKNAVMQHPAGNDVYDFLKKNIDRSFWVKPFAQWQKAQKYRKN